MKRSLSIFAIFTFIILIGIIIFTGCLQSTALCITVLAASTTLMIHQLQIYNILSDEIESTKRDKQHDKDSGDKQDKGISNDGLKLGSSFTVHSNSHSSNHPEEASTSHNDEHFMEGPLQEESKKTDEEHADGVFADGYIPTDDPIADALKGAEEVYSLPMYSKNQSLLSNVDWKRKQEARYQGHMDIKKIEDHKLRFRMNKSRDGFKRSMNADNSKKFFAEELHEREQSQWWGF